MVRSAMFSLLRVGVCACCLFLSCPVAKCDDVDDLLTQADKAGERDDWDLVIACCTKAIRLDPKWPQSYSKRAWAYIAKGEFDKAIADCSEGLTLNPNAKDASWLYTKRARSYDGMCDYPKALRDYERAVDLDPENGEAHGNMAWIYATTSDEKLRDGKKAWEHAKKAHDLEPAERLHSAAAAAAYAECGDFAEAVRWQKESMATKKTAGNSGGPIDKEMRRRLKLYEQKKPFYDFLSDGEALDKRKEYGRALAKFKKGLEMYPEDGALYNDAAWLLATCPDDDVRDGKKAVEYAKKAHELEPDNAGWIDTLAAAYAANGDFDEAVKWQKKAAESANSSNEEGLKQMQQRLKLYQQKKPYRREESK